MHYPFSNNIVKHSALKEKRNRSKMSPIQIGEGEDRDDKKEIGDIGEKIMY